MTITNKHYTILSSVVVIGVISVALVTFFSVQKMTISADKITGNKIALEAPMNAPLGEFQVALSVVAQQELSSGNIYIKYSSDELELRNIVIENRYQGKIMANESLVENRIKFSLQKGTQLSGEIAYITFEALSAGKTNITILPETKLTSILGEDLLYTFKPANIIVE